MLFVKAKLLTSIFTCSTTWAPRSTWQPAKGARPVIATQASKKSAYFWVPELQPGGLMLLKTSWLLVSYSNFWTKSSPKSWGPKTRKKEMAPDVTKCLNFCHDTGSQHAVGKNHGIGFTPADLVSFLWCRAQQIWSASEASLGSHFQVGLRKRTDRFWMFWVSVQCTINTFSPRNWASKHQTVPDLSQRCCRSSQLLRNFILPRQVHRDGIQCGRHLHFAIPLQQFLRELQTGRTDVRASINVGLSTSRNFNNLQSKSCKKKNSCVFKNHCFRLSSFKNSCGLYCLLLIHLSLSSYHICLWFQLMVHGSSPPASRQSKLLHPATAPCEPGWTATFVEPNLQNHWASGDLQCSTAAPDVAKAMPSTNCWNCVAISHAVGFMMFMFPIGLYKWCVSSLSAIMNLHNWMHILSVRIHDVARLSQYSKMFAELGTWDSGICLNRCLQFLHPTTWEFRLGSAPHPPSRPWSYSLFDGKPCCHWWLLCSKWTLLWKPLPPLGKSVETLPQSKPLLLLTIWII